MKSILQELTAQKTLDYDQAKGALGQIARGEVNQSQTAAFLTVYMMRPITVPELRGFRDALLDLCVPLDFSEFDPIDLCGTGGDGKDTFNISTLASLVVAGAGIKVSKHGNYGVSSKCGSSNVLEALGVKFTNDESILKKQLDEAGICFLHAPLFHPAMKNVGPVRKELGLKTFFNMLGPMVNPCRPQKQLVGVYNLELARLYNYVFLEDQKQFVVIHALDGYDEVSLTGDVKAYTTQGERLLRPADFGVEAVSAADIVGGADIAASAKIFMDVLEGNGTDAQNKVVCANAACVIHCYYPEVPFNEAYNLAKNSLDSGKALQALKKVVE